MALRNVPIEELSYCWVEEVRQHQADWDDMVLRYNAIHEEKRVLESHMISLIERARGEGERISLVHLYQGWNSLVKPTNRT